MITPSLHPSEIRAPARKRTGRKLRLAAGLGFAAAFVAASFAAGAYFLGALPEEPPATVTFNRIEDWPEIKNGVPELAPRKSARVEPAPIAATPSLVPPPPADAL